MTLTVLRLRRRCCPRSKRLVIDADKLRKLPPVQTAALKLIRKRLPRHDAYQLSAKLKDFVPFSKLDCGCRDCAAFTH